MSSEVRGAGSGAAVDRVTRTMSLALGVGGAIFALLALQGFLAQHEASAPVWSWGVAASVFVIPIVNGALSAVAPVRVLRILAGVCATGHLVGLLTLIPALDGGKLATELGAPWLFGVSVIATASAAVAWRPAITWPYVAVCIVALGANRYLASTIWIPDLAVQDALHTLLFDAIFTALALATYRAGRALDTAADSAITETRVAATTEARARERTRVEALLHDSVLVALLASARGSARAEIEARTALAELDSVERADDDAQLPGTEWMWRLQALTTDLAPDARFSHDVSGHETIIRSDAAQAVLEAAAEALRNSIQHAGPASRAVHARVTEDEIEVTVLDDGRGFDPADVRPGRLGVAVSILDRMHAVPGGWGVVVSKRGEGTRVSLGWRAAA
ncbi:ATP-binding protein [Pseudolysinimonas sp.]|uniref:sensor histidine kinase n=1 Tax=Pseudolysinimonas sp. TaxID=2680009 RepID=UPI00286C0BE4|nr:ATP-binding protein [Pseudolysinimonas sp.]